MDKSEDVINRRSITVYDNNHDCHRLSDLVYFSGHDFCYDCDFHFHCVCVCDCDFHCVLAVHVKEVIATS